MKRLSHIIGVAALVLMATGGSAVQADSHLERTVPIAGTVIGEHEVVMFAPTCVVPDGADTWWQFSSNGHGNMSHLGRVEYDLTQCTYIGPTGPVSAGTIVFTAANGDTLTVAQSMSSVLIEEPPDPPVAFTVEGEWEVVEGEGRFLNAAGSGELVGRGDIPGDGVAYFADLPDGLADFHFHGEISYDASDRSQK